MPPGRARSSRRVAGSPVDYERYSFALSSWTPTKYRVPSRPSPGDAFLHRPPISPPGKRHGPACSLLKMLAALLLVGLNGLFVAAEFAFVRIRATQVDRLVREGRTGAGLVKNARQKLDQYLAVCRLGITICSLGIGALAEPAIAVLIEPLLERSGVSEALLHPIALALFIASFLHVVFGELAPKTFAIQKAEGTSLFVSAFMRFFYYLLLPLTVVFNGTANAITRLPGVRPASYPFSTGTGARCPLRRRGYNANET